MIKNCVILTHTTICLVDVINTGALDNDPVQSSLAQRNPDGNQQVVIRPAVLFVQRKSALGSSICPHFHQTARYL